MKKLKYLLFIFILFCFVSCETVTTPNQNSSDECEHVNTTWIIDVEATCTTRGCKHEECIDCERILKIELIDFLDHTYSTEWSYDETSHYHECKCGEKIDEESHLSDWIVDIEATCITEGKRHTECTICGKILETSIIEKTSHNYVDGVCTICGDEEKKEQLDIKIEGNYIYFGEYPQTLKEKTVKITSNEPDADGYYLGSDGERYAKVEATPLSSSYYFNNKTTINEETTYYFKVEPIKWQILESNDGTYKLVTDLIIDNQKFNASYYSQTIDGETIYANNYEYSDIRKWLNEDFYNKAFNKALQSCINTTLVDNSVASTGYTENEYACNDTYDKVYLLSYSDVTNTSYGYSSEQYEEDESREKQLTDYAKAKGCYMNTNSSYYNNGEYWLRSPGSYSDVSVRIVSTNGSVSRSWVFNYSVGVVAAITITI